jgi:uncharacterized GH25 family protein
MQTARPLGLARAARMEITVTNLARLAACVLAAATLAGIARASDTRLTLQGRVLSASGKPLPGARVSIYTAQPRTGVGAACPSCSPECTKSAVSDRSGRYSISGLGDHLLYRVLFVAEGRVPEFRDRVDPLAGALDQVLGVRDTSHAPGLRTLVGRVVDPDGQPVAGATVSAVGMQVGDRTAFADLHAMDARIDPAAVSDVHGEFHFTGPDSVRAWVLQVNARALSPRVFPEVAAGPEAALLRLDRGAALTGVVMRDGAPVAGAPICIDQVERDAMSYTRLDTVATDDRGRFTFVNVPAGQDYAFTSVIGALGPWALRTVLRTAGENDSITTLPPFQLERGFHLSGRIVLGDGRPLPRGTELAVSRVLTVGTVTVPLGEDGRFSIEGLPPETVYLNVRLRGYRFAPGNPGYTGRMRGLRIPMLRDRDALEIVLEPNPPANTAAGSSPRP